MWPALIRSSDLDLLSFDLKTALPVGYLSCKFKSCTLCSKKTPDHVFDDIRLQIFLAHL